MRIIIIIKIPARLVMKIESASSLVIKKELTLAFFFFFLLITFNLKQ